MRRFLLGLFVLLGVLGAPAAAGAASISSKITITGIMPEVRFIYVNQAGTITSVVGNTSDNITPRVADPDNKELSMTDSIWGQYVSFMSQHDWRLIAGVTYTINPVSVNTNLSVQTISLNSQPQPLGGNLQLQAGLTPGFGQTG